MSNDLAIATVTATLRRTLQNALTNQVSGVDVEVTTNQPEKKELQTNKGNVNVFLYQVTPNLSWRNADLPTRRADGTLSQRPQVALDLYYLLSFYGDKSKLVPERLLGKVVLMLHSQPVLTRQMILKTVEDSNYEFLATSDLAEQPESVKFSPISLSLEDLSKLWSVFFQTPYALSVAYQATVVLIESKQRPQPSLPVSDRNIQVSPVPQSVPAPQPVIEQIRSQAGGEQLIVANSTLLILGKGLEGAIDFVEIGKEKQNAPQIQNISDTQISLQLPNSLSPGAQRLQVNYKNKIRSNLASFVLHPQIRAIELVRDATTPKINLTLDLPIEVGQQVVLLLTTQSKTQPITQAFSTIASTSRDNPNLISIPISEPMAAGRYLVRVRVDGAESPLEAESPLDETKTVAFP